MKLVAEKKQVFTFPVPHEFIDYSYVRSNLFNTCNKDEMWLFTITLDDSNFAIVDPHSV